MPVTRVVFEDEQSLPVSTDHLSRVVGIVWRSFPYGFASFYPATFLMGHQSPSNGWGAPLVAAVLMALGLAVGASACAITVAQDHNRAVWQRPRVRLY